MLFCGVTKIPFSRPSLTSLRTQAMQDVNTSGLPNADGFLRRAWLNVIVWVQAGMAHLHFGYLDWISLMAVPFTAAGEFLEAWAGLKAVTRKAPTVASGIWTSSGTSTNGTVLPIGTSLQTTAGVAYVTTAAATVAASVAVVPFNAVKAGTAGNVAVGTPMSLSIVVAGINSAGTATTAATGGTDQEIDTSLRTRMLLAYQAPAQGGDKTDYVQWALATGGVTRAWANPLGAGPGTVVVYTMFDATEIAFSGFPQGVNGCATGETRDTTATGDLLAVANSIFPKQPVTALVYSYAPVAQPLAFTVAGLLPNTAAMKTAASTALTGMLFTKADPTANTIIDQSDVDAAISAVPGVISFRVTAPSFPQTPTAGNIFTLGVVTYS